MAWPYCKSPWATNISFDYWHSISATAGFSPFKCKNVGPNRRQIINVIFENRVRGSVVFTEILLSKFLVNLTLQLEFDVLVFKVFSKLILSHWSNILWELFFFFFPYRKKRNLTILDDSKNWLGQIRMPPDNSLKRSWHRQLLFNPQINQNRWTFKL